MKSRILLVEDEAGVALVVSDLLRAMHLLQAGVDITAIALGLGHESPLTTHKYLEADLQMKKKTLSRLKQPKANLKTFAPKDPVLAVLEAI